MDSNILYHVHYVYKDLQTFLPILVERDFESFDQWKDFVFGLSKMTNVILINSTFQRIVKDW